MRTILVALLFAILSQPVSAGVFRAKTITKYFDKIVPVEKTAKYLVAAEIAKQKVEEKPVEVKPAEEKPTEENPADVKPTEEKTVEEKPAEEKP